MWIYLTIVIIVYVTSCIGLGYLAETLVSCRKWLGWVVVLMVIGIALLWPAIFVSYIVYDAHRYLSLHPRDDAPGMVMYGAFYIGAPILFVFSLLLAVIGLQISRRRDHGK